MAPGFELEAAQTAKRFELSSLRRLWLFEAGVAPAFTAIDLLLGFGGRKIADGRLCRRTLDDLLGKGLLS